MRTFSSLLLAAHFALAPVGTLRAAADADARFADANAAFAAGDFTAAADAYRALIADGTRDPDVFFNLGNAEFRLEKPGRAALAYERALVIDPTHAESRQNLRFLTRKSGRLTDEPTAFARFGQRVSENTAVLALAVSAWIFVLALATRLLLRPGAGNRAVLVTVAVLGFLASGLAATVLAAQRLHAPDRDRAIVVAADAKAFTAPALGAKEVISLPEGSVLRVLSTRESWSYVALPGDLRGWVESAAIETLDAFESQSPASAADLVAGA